MSRKDFDKSTWSKHTKGVKMDLSPVPERMPIHKKKRKPSYVCSKNKDGGRHRFEQSEPARVLLGRWVSIQRRCVYCGKKDQTSMPAVGEYKALFLDIDGVVNCQSTRQRSGGFIGIDPQLAFLVGKIILETDCKVVVSSSWRHFNGGLDEIRQAVYPELYSVTPTIGGVRGEEVEAWLKEHPEVGTYAILDDDDDFLPEQPLFKTTWQTGITEEIMQRVIAHLNGVTNEEEKER